MTTASSASVLRQTLVPLVHRRMADERIGLRAMAARSGLARSRLGVLLHHDPAKRGPMSVVELQAILGAIDMDLLEVIAMSDGDAWPDATDAPVRGPVVRMVCAMFRGLAADLTAALDEVHEIDGSEVRPEWAVALRRAVIKRVVQEVHAVIRRRAMLSDMMLP